MRTFVGGNLGTPLIEAVAASTTSRWSRCRASSSSGSRNFARTRGPSQPERRSLRPLSRSRRLGTREGAVVRKPGRGDFAILNRDDPNVWKLAPTVRAHVISFGHARGGAGRQSGR